MRNRKGELNNFYHRLRRLTLKKIRGQVCSSFFIKERPICLPLDNEYEFFFFPSKSL